MVGYKGGLNFKRLAATVLLLGTNLIAFELHTDTAVAADPVDTVCPNRVTLNVTGNLKVPYCSNKLLDNQDLSVRRAVIVIHGTSRNADDYYQYMESAAKKAGKLNETIILAPQFLREEDIKSRNPGNDVLFWTNDGWKEGDPSLSTSSNPRPAQVSSYDVTNFIMAKLADRNIFPNLQNIVIAGHSAGGQFTNRFAAGSNEPIVGLTVIPTRYIVANPSSYLYMDENRRVAGTVSQFAIPTDSEKSNCPNYNEYKYGLEKLNSYMLNIGVEKIRSQYAQREVVYLLGENDTNRNSSSLDKDCPAMLQGKQRFERGTFFYNYIQQYYGSAIADKHRKVTVPRVGHSGRDMFNSDQGVQQIFGQ